MTANTTNLKWTNDGVASFAVIGEHVVRVVASVLNGIFYGYIDDKPLPTFYNCTMEQAKDNMASIISESI